ncbi:MAG: MotA/TolQ/ExbB proton channel family protein, partial [Muribaculaceae bacterium]|nr:MotA/TolQ/ExbB proton channel family protein [Muribaculaceae bacterium]
MAEQTNIQKPQPAAKKHVSSNVSGIKSASLVVLVCFIIAVLFYIFGLGYVGNFKDATKDVPTNLLGTVYKGGIVVP